MCSFFRLNLLICCANSVVPIVRGLAFEKSFRNIGVAFSFPTSQSSQTFRVSIGIFILEMPHHFNLFCSVRSVCVFHGLVITVSCPEARVDEWVGKWALISLTLSDLEIIYLSFFF